MTRQIISDAIHRYERLHAGQRLGPLKAALIDMDGTLYDSMPWHARAWHRMMSELGVETQVDEFFSYEGMTGKATIELLFRRAFGHGVTDEEAERLYRKKSEYFRDNNRAAVMPGARRMVDTLSHNGITPVLVTGSGQATLMAKLTTDFNGNFPPELRITSRDVTNCKPHPEPYLKGLELARCRPWQAIVVENAPLGVQAGVNAGIFTVAVNTGPIPRVKMTEAGADLVFDSMTEFADALPLFLSIVKENTY